MNKPDEFVFYFHFSLPEEDREVAYGFVVQQAAALYQRLGVADFEALLEILYDEATTDLESDFGVHDVSSRPCEEVDGIGYTSYEVAADQQPALLAAWQDWFSSHGGLASTVAPIDSDVANTGTDGDIYRHIKAKL